MLNGDRILRHLGAISMLAVAGIAAAQPANNACSNAIIVTDGNTYNGTTVGATNDGSAGCGLAGGGPDVWYRFTAAEDIELVVDTCEAANYDSVLSIHTGCPGNVGNQIACNDDSCDLRSSVTTSVTGGETYYIRVAGYNNASGTFTLTVGTHEPPPPGSGADVVYSDIASIIQYGPVGGVSAYMFDTHTCNIGSENLRWGNSWNGSPAVGMNAYRLHDGRMIQLGLSQVKYACCAAAGSGCGISCNGVGGSMLGVGCKDIYSAGYNGSWGVMGPRSSVNAFTGAMSQQTGGGPNELYRRLQIPRADMNTNTYPGAQFFVEGVYVGSDDAAGRNFFNNASYKRANINQTSFEMSPSGAMQIGTSAVHAWRAHGLGVNQIDPAVEVYEVEIADEGIFHVVAKVRDLGNGQWRYDYAVFNLSSDRSAGSFSVPAPAGVNISNIGFHDVNYHSGDPYDGTDWISSVSGGAITWRTNQTFAQNPNANAIRWGTMYNFWFEADVGPAAGEATIGLFKPHATPNIAVAVYAVPGEPCPADFNGDGFVNGTDFDSFVAAFEAGEMAADFNGDAFVNGQDFDEFVVAFEAGC